MSVDNLKSRILSSDPEEFVDNDILGKAAPHCTGVQIEFVRQALSSKFRITLDREHFHVVGSAKLGYALFEKRTRYAVLPAFRPFRPESDIDIAIASPALFDVIWDELSIYASAQPRTPWDSGHLGDYMIQGWLRPDHFPKGARLRRCDDWWDAFRMISASNHFRWRTVNGALYHSREHLRRYQIKGVNQCRRSLEEQS
ncbi:MAG: hypothetical protein RLZZ326_2814 [Planctomycetota bacterium]|jgi:hypothetical protein